MGINRDHIYAGDINKIDEAVDWEKVDYNLAQLREESLVFLKDALSR
jgi:hypothetical protein